MAPVARPRISFGVIVLNGEPFTRYCLRSLYPFAHQIIVAEGASPGAAGIARPDGHSSDGTLELLREFKAQEDPDDKVTWSPRRTRGTPTGSGPARRTSRAGPTRSRATGDYLWQVDVDEFYSANATWRRSSGCSSPTRPSTPCPSRC